MDGDGERWVRVRDGRREEGGKGEKEDNNEAMKINVIYFRNRKVNACVSLCGRVLVTPK